MGDVVSTVFRPIGRLLGIRRPRLPDTQEAQETAAEVGIPEEEPQDLDPEQRRRVLEQRRRRAAGQSRTLRDLAGTGGRQDGGLIGGTTGSSPVTGSRLIGS